MQNKQWEEAIRAGFDKAKVFERVMGKGLPEMVREISASVIAHLENSTAIKDFLEMAPKGKGTCCPDSPVDELLRYIGSRRGQIDKSDPAVTLRFAENFLQPVAVFEREVMLEAIASASGLENYEKTMFEGGVGLADAVDRLWLAWFKAVSLPFNAFEGAERGIEKIALAEFLSEFDYTVPTGKHRVPWPLAFPEETRSIAESIDGIISGLEDKKEMLNYFSALKKAYQCVDVGMLEKSWAEVDESWILIPVTTRVLPVHGMENIYEHPFGVSPEFRLAVRTDEGRSLISDIREATPGLAEKLGADPEAIRKKLSNMDIGVFHAAIWSGTCINKRISGQVVPNRQDILEKGGKIFIDTESNRLYLEVYHEALEHNCEPETFRLLKSLVDVPDMTMHTVDHECFHPAGVSSDIHSAIGSAYGLMEESRASVGGILVAREVYPDKIKSIAAMCISRMLRFFHKSTLENSSSLPYVRENMVVSKALHEAGVISLSPSGLKANLDPDKLNAWFSLLEEFTREVIRAYKERDKKSLEEMAETYSRKNPFINMVIEHINDPEK